MLITHRAQYISIFKTQVGGKEERSDKRERAVDDRLMTERERALHSFWQMKALRWCESNIPSRILETVVPIIVSVRVSWWKTSEFTASTMAPCHKGYDHSGVSWRMQYACENCKKAGSLPSSSELHRVAFAFANLLTFLTYLIQQNIALQLSLSSCVRK